MSEVCSSKWLHFGKEDTQGRKSNWTFGMSAVAKENGQKRRDNEELRMCLPKKS